MNDKAKNYRPDIDGLRAVAVLLVLFYHAGFPVSGGFVGVDVFFVISGYLITGIVWSEIREGRFSFKSFYLRRIKRLLPAMVLVVFVTTVVASLLFMPDDYLVFSEGLRYVLTGLGNFHFLDLTQSYFASDAKLLPLIHTWSLAVEEQYYVIWPAVLLLVVSLQDRLGHAALAWLAVIAFVVAVLASEYWARHYPSQAYYLLHARAFELMIGGLLAVYGSQLKPLPPKAVSALSVIGLTMIIVCAFTLDRQSVFPGFNAFWVCLGTALVIYAGGVSERVLSYRLLALRPMVFIGLISYSLYLWHWPLVALANYLNLGLGGWPGLAIMLLSLILAWMSWALVEQRIRRQSGLKFGKAFLLFFLLPLAASVAFHQIMRATDGWPQRLPQALETVAIQYLNDRPAELYPSCHNKSITIDSSERCYIGATAGLSNIRDPDFLLLGDSQANSYAGVFEVLGKEANLVGLMASSGTSPFLVGADRYRKTKSGGTELREKFRLRNDAIQHWIDKGFEGQVVLAAAWHRYLAGGINSFDPDFEVALQQTLRYLESNGNEILIYLAIPELPDNPEIRCIALDEIDVPTLAGEPLRSGGTCQQLRSSYPESMFEKNRTLAREAISALIADIEGARLMDPMDILCVQGHCRTTLEGRYIYQDINHLNFSGSRALGRLTLMEHGNTLIHD
ncbi:MAG: acyltransferase family protein [Halioglobus sp.]